MPLMVPARRGGGVAGQGHVCTSRPPRAPPRAARAWYSRAVPHHPLSLPVLLSSSLCPTGSAGAHMHMQAHACTDVLSPFLLPPAVVPQQVGCNHF